MSRSKSRFGEEAPLLLKTDIAFQCTEAGEESFDICEPHLAAACSSHERSHHFVRQTRPFAEFDDDVRETPLMVINEMEEERRAHELIIMSVCCVLLASSM
jgi:hypothetical protein